MKLLLCTGEVTAKERTGLRHFLTIKPDSNDKTNQKYVPVILKTYDLSTGYTFNPRFSRRNTSLKTTSGWSPPPALLQDIDTYSYIPGIETYVVQKYQDNHALFNTLNL